MRFIGFKERAILKKDALTDFVYINVLIKETSLCTDLPRPLSNNLWIIPSQKVDWDRVTFSIRKY